MNKVSKITALSCLVTAGLTLSGCELLGPRHGGLLPLESVTAKGLADKDNVLFKQLENKLSAAENRLPAELYPNNRRPIGTPVQRRVVKSAKKDRYTFNFDDADLGEVAKVILGDTLKLNYVLSPKVAGKVTLQTTQPLTTEELLPTLEMVLKMNNAALVKDGKVYHIEPVADALFNSDVTTFGHRDGYQTRVIPIRNVAVQDLVEVLKPLVGEKAILAVDGAKNLMVVSGMPDEIGRVLDMVDTFDIDLLNGRSFGLFPLAHVEPDAIIKELEEIFQSKGDESEFFRFIPIERMNAVLAITHQAKYLRDIENWVFRLDKANTASGGGVNVYKVQHADAEVLAGTLNEIFTGAAHQDASAKVAPGQSTAQATNKRSGSPTSQSKTSSSLSSSRSRTTSTRSSGGTAKVANVEDVRIIADKSNNALIVVAKPREYDVILPVIKDLDVLPLQVLVDATIVEVNLNDDLKYGIQWFLDHKGSSISSGDGPATLGQIAVPSAAAVTSGGLTAVYNSGVMNALLSSLATKNRLNVISSPSLMVLNNQQAKINVGDQVPVQTSSTSVPISSGGSTPGFATSNSIQYIDTGVTLEVTPRVNANGIVIMDISQIVSNAQKTTTGVNGTATIAKKEIQSSVVVNDGETIVLGGLITQNDTFNKTGIPWLHELPWIGALFGNTENNKDRKELVVLITPRVVKSRLDSRLISNEFKRKLTGIYQGSRERKVY